MFQLAAFLNFGRALLAPARRDSREKRKPSIYSSSLTKSFRCKSPAPHAPIPDFISCFDLSRDRRLKNHSHDSGYGSLDLSSTSFYIDDCDDSPATTTTSARVTAEDFQTPLSYPWESRPPRYAVRDSIYHAISITPAPDEDFFRKQPHNSHISIISRIPEFPLPPKSPLAPAAMASSMDPGTSHLSYPRATAGSPTSSISSLTGMNSPTKSMSFGLTTDPASSQEHANVANPHTHPHMQPASGAPRPPVSSSSKTMSNLVCNCHRTTGRRPPGLSGGSMTVVGDNLYVFGGHALDSGRLSEHLYELDLVHRHWTRLSTTGSKPSPRYFHSMCALGETKLVLFGGSTIAPVGVAASKNGTVPVSEIHLYDIPSREWTPLNTRNSPTPRFAHCASILPSGAVFSTPMASTSALHHNPPSNVPNHGRIGVEIDGRGAAEMIVIGGQYADDGYSNTIDVFNFRSLTWTSSQQLSLNKCGIYRSAVATMSGMPASALGAGNPRAGATPQVGAIEEESEEDEWASGAPAIFYNNCNFISPEVDLQVRHTDGTIATLVHRGQESPPGLRFPAAGVINDHFILGGSFIRSDSHEYMMWALNLRTLEWHRIGISSGILERGSWNRGIAWPKRNSYIVVGNRLRDFEDDYGKRRVNFADFATVELEAFGLYDKPNESGLSGTSNTSSFQSEINPMDAVGLAAMGSRELCDMEILAIDGNRLAVNSHIIARRWGPYFLRLMNGYVRDGAHQEDSLSSDTVSSQAAGVGQGDLSGNNRTSNMTIMPTSRPSVANSMNTLWGDESSSAAPSLYSATTAVNSRPISPSSSRQPVLRSRLLFLPHTYFTIRALVHFLYTSSLPPLSSPLCTAQILCSLLQIARPYNIEGLLEATVQRLHQVLDGRCCAAIFNASAMAAGGGNAVGFAAELFDAKDHTARNSVVQIHPPTSGRQGSESQRTIIEGSSEDENGRHWSASMYSLTDPKTDNRVWVGDWSVVVGLQKRALRGLSAGKRMREQFKFSSGDQDGSNLVPNAVTSPVE